MLCPGTLRRRLVELVQCPQNLWFDLHDTLSCQSFHPKTRLKRPRCETGSRWWKYCVNQGYKEGIFLLNCVKKIDQEHLVYTQTKKHTNIQIFIYPKKYQYINKFMLKREIAPC